MIDVRADLRAFVHGRAADASSSDQPPGAAAAPHGGLPAHAPAAGGEPAAIGRVGAHRARRRPDAAAGAAEDRRRGDRSRPARVDRHDWHRPPDGPGRARPEHHLRRDRAGPHQDRDPDRHDAARRGRAAARQRRHRRRERSLRAPHPRTGRTGGDAGHRRVGRRAPAGAGDRGPAAPRLPARLDARRLAEGEAGNPRRRSAGAKARGGAHTARPRGLGARAEGQDRVAGAGRDVRVAAPVLPAPAAQGDPGAARRGRGQRGHRAAREARETGAARAGRNRGHPRDRSAGPHERQRLGRSADDPHLHRLGARGAVVGGDHRPHRPGRRPRRPRRGPLRPRQGQGSHRRGPWRSASSRAT